MAAVQLTIIGKPDCHLCDVAQAVIDGVLNELRDSGEINSGEITVEKRSILDNPQLYEKYWEKIPVVLINGREHAQWRVDAAKLRSELEGN